MSNADDPTLDRPLDPGRAVPTGLEAMGDGRAPDAPPRIGAYTLIRVLGKGGMGVVFEAEQNHPRRLVALKVIRASYVTADLIRRFEYESHVLGRLQHPGIAQVYQAGSVKDRRGRTTPYFAMELIKGETLTRYASDRELDTRQRLELLARICDAVYHAHQKGVIHRDLKPGNILVGEDGQPKILDFGVARATDSDLQQTTMRTDVGQLVGTVQYMSPEQASGNPDDLDTRSDVYSLGVIAYELLSGQLPYDLRSKMVHEAVRVIREEDPGRLSTVNRALRGDVETIVAKAMEKDKSRRYQSAEALANDIRRSLNDEPITARPPSPWYQLTKFGRRHKGLAAGLVASSVVVLAGIASTGLALKRALAAESDLTAQLSETEAARRAEADARARADEARELAEEERQRADDARERAVLAEAETARRADELQKVADFQADILRRVDPAAAGRLLTAEVKSRFAEGLERSGAPKGGGIRNAERDAFAERWELINSTDLARDFIDRTMLKPAVEMIERRFTDDPAVDARLRQALADRYRELGLYDAAMPLQERALETRRSLLGVDHIQTRNSMRSMGDLLKAQGRHEEAAPYYREVLETRTPRMRRAVARLLEGEGKHAEAEPYLREALRSARLTKGEEHVATLRAIDRLGTVLHAQGRLDEAEPLRREAVEKGRRVLRDSSLDMIEYVGKLGGLLLDLGKLAEAEPLLRESLEKHRRVRGEQHPDTLVAIIQLGSLLEDLDRHADAADLLESAELPSRAAFTGDNADLIATLLKDLGDARAALGRFPEAEVSLLDAHAILAADGAASVELSECTQSIVDLYTAWHAAEPGKEHDRNAAKWKSRQRESGT